MTTFLKATALLSFATAAASMLLLNGAAQAQPDSGAQLFSQRCAACHVGSGGRPSLLAPPILGISGRKAGTAAFAYSPALKAAKFVWTRETLDAFLTDPQRVVPGTRMPIGVPNARQRASIIDHLLVSSRR